MKVGEAVKFDTKKLKMVGFTDLGEHTSLHQQSKKGDHGLVIMFQPFQGRWVQAVACFLSKGCATGTVLHHLIMECILLLEKSGFFVDAVITDGASWNRNMWTKFGVTEEKVLVTHPSDVKRQLWFLSDFPHLIKNLRNFIVKHEETWVCYKIIFIFSLNMINVLILEQTPDGIIKLKHWEALLDLEHEESYNLKIAYKLTSNHIRPKHYQKMNVAMAFQVIPNTYCD